MKESGGQVESLCTSSSQGVESVVATEEVLERVLSLINRLPAIYRDVLLLKHLRNLSYGKIAEFLGISESAVEARLYRARVMLRDKLKEVRENDL
jgi:RNA polymerase sigma-70 factor (ECF subfamily)